jgi:hypothetical protein
MTFPTGFGERFLSTGCDAPFAAPERAWGEGVLAVDLPGGPFAIEGLAAAQAAALRMRFGDRCLLREPRRGDLETWPRVRVRRAPPGAFRAVETRGWEYTLDFHFEAARLAIAGLGMAALVAGEERATAELRVADAGDGVFAGTCENVLRVMVAYRLLALGGVMVHAAAVAAGGGAVIAAGRSGAGKSTFAACAARAGEPVLSDDLVALVPGDVGPFVSALPFTGDLPPAAAGLAPVPLAALLRLEQAPADSLRPLGAAEAVATLLACAPVVNVDPWRREALLAALQGLVARAGDPPGWALRCTPDGGWPLAATLLGAAAEAPVGR